MNTLQEKTDRAADIEPAAFSPVSNRRPSLAEISEVFRVSYNAVRTGVVGATVGASPRSTKPAKQVFKIKRRLRGLLVEMQGDDARVLFVQDDKSYFYDLPTDQVRKAGITRKNQPFEMDEFETEDASGNYMFGYRFRPLATSSDAYVEQLPLDEERQRKYEAILKRLAKP